MMDAFVRELSLASRLQSFRSRQEWRELPLEWVLVPSLDAPVLVHERPPLFTDVTGFTSAALPKLEEMRAAYKRTPLEKRPQFAKALRDLWVQIVDQADYYAFPDDPPSLFMFSDA